MNRKRSPAFALCLILAVSGASADAARLRYDRLDSCPQDAQHRSGSATVEGVPHASADEYPDLGSAAVPFQAVAGDEHLTPSAASTTTLTAFIPDPPQASEMGMIASARVDVREYHFVLDEMLYTGTGDDRGFGPEHDLAQDNIATLFADYGLAVMLEPVPYGVSTYYNVVGTMVGTDFPEQYYIVGAHYDSVSNPGADDNASGVALLIEAARVLGQGESLHTIRFIAFDREEQGLHGANSYVNTHVGDDILAMISTDMVAYNTGTNTVEIFANIYSHPLRDNLVAAVTVYGNGLIGAARGTSCCSDHVPFQAAGYQAALFIEDWGNPYYHTSWDTVDTPNYIDYTFAANATRSVVGYLVDQAGVTVPPPGIRAPEPDPDAFIKNRYLSMTVPSNELHFDTAIRVRLTALSTADGPWESDSTAGSEPEYRYVNLFRDDQDQPIFDCPDSDALRTTFKCATLSCDPEYRDWTGELGGQVLHVTSPAIVPGSEYDVSVLLSFCEGGEVDCPHVSSELPLFTGQWGDVEPGQLDVLDVAAVVDQVKDVSEALGKPRTQLQPREVDPFANVTVLDVAFAVDALKESPYPFAGPDSCP